MLAHCIVAMIPTKLQLRRALSLLITDIVLTRAVLHNVTVDDAAATGIIPQYLPASSWTQGATCSGCGAQPDPAQAFNGTWHDATFTPSDGIAKAVEFTFTGSAIYIFFILANTIQFVDTVTDMNFILDDIAVGTFVHDPSTSTNFQYNVPVYVNGSLSSGQHHMRMEAAGNRSALMLFDYLIYSTDTDNTTSTISSPQSSAFSSSSASVTQSTSSKSNIAPIIGGALAGIAVLLVIIGILLCRWRRKRRDSALPQPDRILAREINHDGISLSGSAHEDASVEPFTWPYQTALVSSNNNSSSGHQYVLLKSKLSNQTELRGDSDVQPSASSLHPPNSSSTAPVQNSSGDTTVLREQVEILMDEVARLRHLHLQDQSAFEGESEAPPGYSEGRASPDSLR